VIVHAAARRGRAAADPDRQAARRARDRDHLDGREGALARGAGADETIGYGRLRRAGARADRRRRVHAVYDGSAKTTFDESLARCGRAATWSSTARERAAAAGRDRGPEREVALPHRPTLAHYGQTGDELRSRAGELLEWIAAGELDVRSAPATRSRTPRAPSPTSSRAAPRAS
jgi:hypothetical protein